MDELMAELERIRTQLNQMGEVAHAKALPKWARGKDAAWLEHSRRRDRYWRAASLVAAAYAALEGEEKR